MSTGIALYTVRGIWVFNKFVRHFAGTSVPAVLFNCAIFNSLAVLLRQLMATVLQVSLSIMPLKLLQSFTSTCLLHMRTTNCFDRLTIIFVMLNNHTNDIEVHVPLSMCQDHPKRLQALNQFKRRELEPLRVLERLRRLPTKASTPEPPELEPVS